jgi:hypothetical protein
MAERQASSKAGAPPDVLKWGQDQTGAPSGHMHPNEPQGALETDLPRDWPKLIRKLRWVGLDDEAWRLQQAAFRVPPDERQTVSAGPFSTD